MNETRGWDISAHNSAKPTGSGVDAEYRRLDGVRSRRMLAFLLDYTLIAVFSAILWTVLAIGTLGIALFFLPPLGAIVALLYLGLTLSGDRQATWGMQFFSIRMERLDGAPIDFFTAIVHAILFWAAHSVLTPLLLLVSLFTAKKQLVHDLLLGTVVVRSQY